MNNKFLKIGGNIPKKNDNLSPTTLVKNKLKFEIAPDISGNKFSKSKFIGNKNIFNKVVIRFKIPLIIALIKNITLF